MRHVIRNLLKRLPQPVVFRVFDPYPASIETARNEWKSEVIACASWEEALQGAEVKWAFIGSWNCMHYEQILAALQAGKHVFAEKPLATNLKDCLAIRDAWKAAGTMFFFGLVLRYSKFYQQLYASSRRSQVGKVISFEFNETLGFNHGGYIHGNWRRSRKQAGTHLLEKCCHDIDIAQWLIGSVPVRAASFGGLNFFVPENRRLAETLGQDDQGRKAYQTWADPNRVDAFDGRQDIVDNQVVILEYANGVRASFHTNCNAALPERRLYLLGAEGALRADATTGAIETQRVGFGTKPERLDLAIHDGHAGGDEVMAAHLAKSILEDAPPIAGMEDALKSAISCLGIDQALDERRVVDLHPLWTQAGLTPSTFAEV